MKRFLTICAAAALGVATLAAPAWADEDPQAPLSAPVSTEQVQSDPQPATVDESPAPASEEAPGAAAQDEQEQADEPIVTEWHTWKSPTYAPDAKNANDVGWPQSYVGAGQIAPTDCSTTYQQDRYVGTREQIDAVIGDHVLDGLPPEDGQIEQGWTFVSTEPCAEVVTPTPEPTPLPSETTPVPVVAPEVPVVAAPTETPTLAPVVSEVGTTATLAATGSNDVLWGVLVAAMLIVAGLTIVLLSRRGATEPPAQHRR
jgi:hypothetical protein